ncbi:putative protein N(5)-glutamine methyltransferase [Streptomyces muensis]|uniref:peptide chain release factor N(5)-glutamine methyltransferase n=1 Tax=Streptomyces muensis TaxID=1077944 RepID=A0A9X1PV62_STRM4|nr:putative protein N(5)-glutamine methyltransferase [Streptomyces muensis]MCF1593581.1 putative protein N(5)-glutamine methyltransferase [Streptomyces muensis]
MPPLPSSSSSPSPSSSSSSPSPLTPDAVVSALRAAGCVFAEDEARLILAAAGTPDELAAMVDRRVTGLPLELVLGWAEFRGLRIAVEPGVFVPRRRTEFLVEQALAHAPDASVVVDLCCGSGAVGAALAAALGGVELHSADIDPAAVRCARRNVAPFGGQVHAGDLFEALPGSLRGCVGILAANVPYVPSDEVGLLPAEARDHEPRVALDGGADGLDVLRRVAAEAPRWLAPGGCLLVETSERQAPTALDAFTRSGLSARLIASEERYANVVVGLSPAGG